MENQESSVNPDAITADDINMDPIGNTQSRDIYEVQPGRNKALKLLALHILKHLPEDILREEPDFSSIKSNNIIPDYGSCGECDIPILTEDPPRSLVLNVCGDILHRTCAKAMYKDGALLCSCGMADNSDPLLPFQYSIVDYGGREKSSISESERPSLVNLKNLGYNILKSLDDKTVRDIDSPELGPCSECSNDILTPPLKEFTYLKCGHLFHRLCIEKKLFLGAPSICPFPGCEKNVDILEEADAFGVVSNMQDSSLSGPKGSSHSSGISPLYNMMSERFILSSPIIRMEEIENTGFQQARSYLRCAKCSEDLSSCLPPIDFLRFPPQPQGPSKPLVYLTCKHIVHYDCIDNPCKLCPVCSSSSNMETDDLETPTEPSTAQKKRSRGSGASTEKSSSKKAKKTGGKKVSSMLKELIEELLTDVPVPTAEENLEEASENGAGIFLQLSNRIDNAETKNEDASRGLIFSYFDFGEAVFKRYKELKTEFGKDGSKALVKKEVRKAIPETRCSDEALRKRTERSKKMYKLFNSIGKEKIVRIRSILPSYVLNLTEDETKYVMAEILTA